jgi:hypothetical protein
VEANMALLNAVKFKRNETLIGRGNRQNQIYKNYLSVVYGFASIHLMASSFHDSPGLINRYISHLVDCIIAINFYEIIHAFVATVPRNIKMN